MSVLYLAAEWLASFVEAALCLFLMHLFFADQFARRKQRRFFLLFACIAASGTLLLNLAQLAFNIATTLYVVVALLVSGLLLYKSRPADLLILILCFLSALNLIDVVLLKAISLFSSDAIVAQLMTGFSLERVGMLVLSKGLDVLVLWLFAKFIRRLQGRQRQPGPGPVLAFAACGYLAALYLQYTILGQALALSQQQMRVSLVLVTLLFLAYLVLRLHLLKEAQRRTALEKSLLAKNYELAQASYAANAKLYHDMHGHFALLAHYLEGGEIIEAQRYLARLTEGATSGSVTHYTGIEAIDFILTQKLNDAQAQGIHVTANAEFPKDCAIDPVDLCTILTNLLDNAIRAAAACPDGTLSLSIRRFRQTILIRVTNSAMAPPRTAGRRLLTTKRDAAHHGWGLASVKSAAEKYDGTLETSYEDGQFSASMLLFYQ